MVIALAVRFFLKLGISADKPFTPELWGDIELALPNGIEATCFWDVLSNRRVYPVLSAKKAALPVSEVLLPGLPVALLEAQPDEGG